MFLSEEDENQNIIAKNLLDFELSVNVFLYFAVNLIQSQTVLPQLLSPPFFYIYEKKSGGGMLQGAH